METKVSMRALPIHALAILALSSGNVSCTVAKKKSDGTKPLLLAQVIDEADLAALQAIADSPAANLPRDLGGEDRTAAAHEAATPPAEGWRGPGLNPDEVNPGDIFSERRGTVLRKTFSLLDTLPDAARRPLLWEFTETRAEHLTFTLSPSELSAPPGTPLPTRAFDLQVRANTHAVDPGRLADFLTAVAAGTPGADLFPPSRLTLVQAQLESVKRRLRSGETLHIVTSVTESPSALASNEEAPMSKGDIPLVRNALQARYPHLHSLAAAMKGDAIEIKGKPRLLWEFDARALSLEGDRLLVGEKSLTDW